MHYQRTFDGTNYSIDDLLEAEQIIAQADGEEYAALSELYIDFSKPWRGWYNKSPHYNLWYGLLLQHKGAHEEACKQFEEVLSLGYDHWRLHWYIAQSLLALNDVNQAQELLLEIIKKQEDFQPALDLLYDISNHDIKAEHKNETQKYVIGPWPGGLGVCLHSLLNHLARCEREGFTPVIHWGAKSLYHKPGGFNENTNVWEYYFEPVSDLKYQRGDPVHIFMPSVWGKFSYNHMSQSARDHAYQLIQKFIKIKPNIQQKIDDFYHQNILGKHTIAIHIRGTDKIKEQKRVDPKKIIAEALKHADEHTQFFLATDEQKLLDRMIALLPGRKVVYYDCYRSETGKPLHVKSRRPSFAQVGEDVLVEMVLMSKCDLLVHTLSNVSNFPLYLNPKLPDIVFKAYYKDILS